MRAARVRGSLEPGSVRSVREFPGGLTICFRSRRSGSCLTATTNPLILSVRRAGHYLGVLIQNPLTSFNPGRIVIGGPLCDLGPSLLDAAFSCLEGFRAIAPPLPELRLARFGSRSVGIGAAALVKHVLTRPTDYRAE